MPRKPDPLEPWMFGAIELIVRRQLSLRQAASQLGQEISPQQADNIQGHIRFQDALEDARFTYYAEVGSNPRLTKDKVVGQLFVLAQTLAVLGEHYKAADALFKLAKVQNWTNVEDSKDKPALGNLNQADIDRIRVDFTDVLDGLGAVDRCACSGRNCGPFSHAAAEQTRSPLDLSLDPITGCRSL